MKTIDFAKIKVSCENCNLAELCLPRGLDKEDMELLEQTLRRANPLQKGEYLFRAGDKMGSLHAVRSGSVKLYTHDDEGNEQIIGFYFPGEILGLDGIETDTHTCSAIAMETSSLCSFPFNTLSDLCMKIPALQEQMFRLMSRELSYENQLLLTIGKKSAEERIATFLLSLSNRFKRLGYSANEFKLAMSRQEIGNYLGLTIETVSRIFGRLQKSGLIETDRKFITIADMPGLQAMCGATSNNKEGSSAA